MKRILKNSSVKANFLKDLFLTSGLKKNLVTLSRRQKINVLSSKLKVNFKNSMRTIRNKHSQLRKLEVLKQQILRNPQNYNIALDKDKLFDGNEFDVSLKQFNKDNTVKFYQIQIITPRNYKYYIVLTSRGLVGNQPIFNISKFRDINSAFKLFKRKFASKIKDGYQRSDYTFLRQCNSRMANKKLVKTYLISQLV